MKKNKAASKPTALAREEGFEPPTNRFVAWYSIQLSYTRFADSLLGTAIHMSTPVIRPLAEREGFEPSVESPYDDLANRSLRPLGHLSKGTNSPSDEATRAERAGRQE